MTYFLYLIISMNFQLYPKSPKRTIEMRCTIINSQLFMGFGWWYNQQLPLEFHILQQRMEKKLPFGVKIFKKTTFLRLVDDWTAALNIDAFIHQHYFKYFPRFIIELEKSFISNCMKYAIVKRFPLLLADSFENEMLALSTKIKETYSVINIKAIMKVDAYFYFLSVFLTRVISQFLCDVFQDIEIDKELESQIYIILVFVIIGLEVAPKTYQINRKKIIHQKCLIKSKPKSLCKLETIEMLHQKRSSNKITPHKGPRKLVLERKWTNVSCKQQQPLTPLDEFKQNLKENLLVKALPKLVKKKIKGCDFDYNADRHEAQMKGDEKKYIFLRESEVVTQPCQEYINSNQNSSSFQYFFNNDNGTKFYMHRNVKISHRHQLVLNAKNLRNEHFLKSAQETPENKNQQLDDDKGNKNWRNIVRQIRQHAFQTNKINSFIHTAQDFTHDYQRNSNIETIRDSEVDFPKRLTMVQSQKQCVLIPKTTNFGSYWIHQKQQPFAKVQKEPINQYHPINVNKLRKDRHIFDQACEKRHHESHSSMFNITSFHK